GWAAVSSSTPRGALDQLQRTSACACLVVPAFRARLPAHTVPLVTDQPYRGFALALARFYPDALKPVAAASVAGEPSVHPSAALEEGARIQPGAVIGREARIGPGTVIAAGALGGHLAAGGRASSLRPRA